MEFGGNFSSGHTADGGDGIDILGVDVNDVQFIGGNVTNFETLELAQGGSATFDLDDLGFDNLILSAQLGNVTVDDLSGTLTISASQFSSITIDPASAPGVQDLDILFNKGGFTDIRNFDVSDFASVNVTTDTAADDVDVAGGLRWY